MVYSSYNDKNELQGIIVSCACGCSNMEFRLVEDIINISVYGSDFYNHQGLGTLRDSFSYIIDKFRESECIFCSVFMTLNEVREFLKLSNEFIFAEDSGDIFENSAHLELEYVHLLDGYEDKDECDLLVVLDMPLKDLIRNKGYRGAEICMKKDEWLKMIKKFEIEVEESYKKYTDNKKDEEK